MKRVVIGAVMMALASLLAGCKDSTSPRDRIPPAAPRGFYSVTGDGAVYLHWLGNTESDVTGYRVYMSACASGPGCPFDRIGSTGGTSFTVNGLTNGVTRFFAVSAVDAAGNESDLTYEDVFDTPRPEGFGQSLSDANLLPQTSGWDFSQYAVVPDTSSRVDIYYARTQNTDRMVAPFTDTDIQDAGYATSLDAVDFAPANGWSPTGTVELVSGHCYVVHTNDDHYAKFRITSISAGHVVMDWAYQVDSGNPELKARRAVEVPVTRVRRTLAVARR